jgi:hypothetical protein
VLPSESPLISIVSLSGTRINPSQKLKLSGGIISGAGMQSGSVSGVASWSVDDASIPLVARSLSEISKNLMLSSSVSTVAMSWFFLLTLSLDNHDLCSL